MCKSKICTCRFSVTKMKYRTCNDTTEKYEPFKKFFFPDVAHKVMHARFYG